MADSAPLICKDIHKTFDQLEVLKGISLETKKGDVVSLIGSSGSGKSTFLRCVNMLETPTSGDIIVHGDPIRFTTNRKGERIPADNKQVELIRARLSMVFQSFNLWSHMTVLENIIEAPIHVLKVPRKEAIERAEAYLEKVGIYERKDYYPAGSDAVRRTHFRSGPRARWRSLEGHAEPRGRRQNHDRGNPRDVVCAGCVIPGPVFASGRD